LYLPVFNVTEVPPDDPGNDFGEALLPATLMVKSEGLLVPQLTFVVTVKNVFEPIGAVELPEEPLPPFEEEEEDVLFVEFFGAA
jgi:hypothetical protein